MATCLLVLCCKHSTHASTVRGDIDYQLYRDFAENKGMFRPGAIDIPIHTRDGLLLGRLDQAPMPDFSSVEAYGRATLITPQHLVGVAHNADVLDQVFFGVHSGNPDVGRTSYDIIRYNDHSGVDFHVPRLNKLVVDAAPAVMTNTDASSYPYLDAARFPAFYRLGSGTQYTFTPGERKVQTQVAEPYMYLTGGTVGRPTSPDSRFFYASTANLSHEVNGLLSNRGEKGDSGSPLFAWDAQREAWVLIAALATQDVLGNKWSLLIPDFIAQSLADSEGAQILLEQPGTTLRWGKASAADTYRIVQQGENSRTWETALARGENRDAGKNIRFGGMAGVLLLGESIDQGAGSLTFDIDFDVRPQDSQIWKGGGLSIAKDVTVNWQVNGAADDALHKVGEGTLRVSGVGSNAGALKVGDGTVILAQRPDGNGKKRAFEQVGLFSGRPTVVLSDSTQINPDNLYFGPRGGRLDLDGNDLELSHIRHVDSGARIVNHSLSRAATLKVTASVRARQHQIFLGNLGETDPARVNGPLNLTFEPQFAQGFLVMTGGANLNGRLTVANGMVQLQGAPVPHAGHTYLSDWDRSRFRFDEVNVNEDKAFKVGLHADVATGTLTAARNSQVVLGYHRDVTATAGSEAWKHVRKCHMDDHSGYPKCLSQLSEGEAGQAGASTFSGVIQLAENAQLAVGNAHYTGSIQADRSARLSLAAEGLWQLTADSTLGSLLMEQGATIAFSGDDNAQTHTLRIQGNYSGEGVFTFRRGKGFALNGQLVIEGDATGSLLLDVPDFAEGLTGKEGPLTLLSLDTGRSSDELRVALLRESDESGSQRYRLSRTGAYYQLVADPLVPPESLADGLHTRLTDEHPLSDEVSETNLLAAIEELPGTQGGVTLGTPEFSAPELPSLGERVDATEALPQYVDEHADPGDRPGTTEEVGTTETDSIAQVAEEVLPEREPEATREEVTVPDERPESKGDALPDEEPVVVQADAIEAQPQQAGEEEVGVPQPDIENPAEGDVPAPVDTGEEDQPSSEGTPKVGTPELDAAPELPAAPDTTTEPPAEAVDALPDDLHTPADIHERHDQPLVESHADTAVSEEIADPELNPPPQEVDDGQTDGSQHVDPMTDDGAPAPDALNEKDQGSDEEAGKVDAPRSETTAQQPLPELPLDAHSAQEIGEHRQDQPSAKDTEQGRGDIQPDTEHGDDQPIIEPDTDTDVSEEHAGPQSNEQSEGTGESGDDDQPNTDERPVETEDVSHQQVREDEQPEHEPDDVLEEAVLLDRLIESNGEFAQPPAQEKAPVAAQTEVTHTPPQGAGEEHAGTSPQSLQDVGAQPGDGESEERHVPAEEPENSETTTPSGATPEPGAVRGDSQTPEGVGEHQRDQPFEGAIDSLPSSQPLTPPEEASPDEQLPATQNQPEKVVEGEMPVVPLPVAQAGNSGIDDANVHLEAMHTPAQTPHDVDTSVNDGSLAHAAQNNPSPVIEQPLPETSPPVTGNAPNAHVGGDPLDVPQLGLVEPDTSLASKQSTSTEQTHVSTGNGGQADGEESSEAGPAPREAVYARTLASLIRDGRDRFARAELAAISLDPVIGHHQVPLAVAVLDEQAALPERINDYLVVAQAGGRTLVQRLQKNEQGRLSLVRSPQGRSLLDMNMDVEKAAGSVGGEIVRALLDEARDAGWDIKAIYGVQPDEAAEGGVSLVRFLPQAVYERVSSAATEDASRDLAQLIVVAEQEVAALSVVRTPAEPDPVRLDERDAAGSPLEIVRVEGTPVHDAVVEEVTVEETGAAVVVETAVNDAAEAVAEVEAAGMAMAVAAQAPKGIHDPSLRRQAYADALDYLGRAANRFDDQLFAELAHDDMAPGDSRLWAGIFDTRERITGSGMRKDSQQSSRGLAAGALYRPSDDLSLGLGIARSEGRISSDGKAGVDLTQAGLVVRQVLDEHRGVYVGAGVGVAHAGIDTRRNHEGIAAKGSTSATQYHASTRLGSRFAVGDWAFEPDAGLSVEQTRLKGTTEKNAALRIKDRQHSGFHASTGLTVSRNVQLDGWMLRPELSAHYRYRLGNAAVVRGELAGETWSQPGATGRRGEGGYGLGLELSKNRFRARAEAGDDGAVNLNLGVRW